MVALPSAEILRRLAVSDSGFVFDPVSGNSYSTNVTGLTILRLMQRSLPLNEIVQALQQQFAVPAVTAEAEVVAYARELRELFR